MTLVLLQVVPEVAYTSLGMIVESGTAFADVSALVMTDFCPVIKRIRTAVWVDAVVLLQIIELPPIA